MGQSINCDNGGGRVNPIKSSSTLKKAAAVGAGYLFLKYKAQKKNKPKFYIKEQGDDWEPFNQWKQVLVLTLIKQKSVNGGGRQIDFCAETMRIATGWMMI